MSEQNEEGLMEGLVEDVDEGFERVVTETRRVPDWQSR